MPARPAHPLAPPALLDPLERRILCSLTALVPPPFHSPSPATFARAAAPRNVTCAPGPIISRRIGNAPGLHSHTGPILPAHSSNPPPAMTILPPRTPVSPPAPSVAGPPVPPREPPATTDTPVLTAPSSTPSTPTSALTLSGPVSLADNAVTTYDFPGGLALNAATLTFDIGPFDPDRILAPVYVLQPSLISLNLLNVTPSRTYALIVGSVTDPQNLALDPASAQVATLSASTTGVFVTITPATLVPAIFAGNNFENYNSAFIKGDLRVKRDFLSQGSFNSPGSIYAGGSITPIGSFIVDGFTSPNEPNITIPVIDIAWLKAHAYKFINVPASAYAYEISSITAPDNAIICYTGPVTFKNSVTITGKNITVVIDGDLTIKPAASFGSPNQRAVVNLIATGTLQNNGDLYLQGSISTNGSLENTSTIDVIGTVLSQLSVVNYGNLTITPAPTPSFYPY